MEQFDQLLTCAICLDRYRNPKLLPCQHSFCMEPCMEGLINYVTRQVFSFFRFHKPEPFFFEKKFILIKYQYHQYIFFKIIHLSQQIKKMLLDLQNT